MRESIFFADKVAKKQRMKRGGTKMRKKLLRMIYGLEILVIAWMIVSYIEIISKNLSVNPQYSPINFFTLIFK